MKALTTYIEFLLMTRHYAFVPGIGGFMLHEEDSMMLRGGRLMPQHRMLKFNRFMDHDDGMLCNIIMQAEGLSYDDANAAISMHVSALLNRVQHEGRCQMGHMGYLFFDNDCHIAFIAADQMNGDPTNYGLPTINTRTWQEVESERNAALHPEEHLAPVVELKHKRSSEVIELPKVWLRRAAIVLLVITFFFANFIIGHDNASDQQFANILDTKTLTRTFNTLDPQSWDESWETANVDSLIAETLKPSETLEPSEKAETIAPAPEKQYLIIVGSCTTLEDADYQVKRLGKKGYHNLSILPKDDRYRIFISSFDVKAEAEAYLEELRQTSSFADAWLLAVRTSSLSHIIKNKDNDQLPMELSHPNKSAERDQG